MRYCKDIENLLLWKFWKYLTIPVKIILSISSKLSCLFACKKSTSSFSSLLRYYKEIANLLIWVIWACLATHTENDNSNLKKPLTFICMQKIKSRFPWDNLKKLTSPPGFSGDIAKICKFIILGNLGMPDCMHRK